MSGIGVYGIMLAGWASGSKYPLLGSVRATAQLLSTRPRSGSRSSACLIQAGTLSTRGDRRRAVLTDGWQSIFTEWYWLAGDRAVRHLPHRRDRGDEPPAVRPRRGGAGTRRRVQHRVHRHPVRDLLPRRVHERDHDVGGGRDAVPRWPLGTGARVPRRRRLRQRRGSCRSSGSWPRCLCLLFCTVWVRASLPRMRYDRLMALGWKYLIEIAILWVLVSGALVVAREEGWNVWIVTPIAAARRVRSRSASSTSSMPKPASNVSRSSADGPALRVLGHVAADGQAAPHRPSIRRRSARSRRACTAATSSTATRTAWRSASAASCARACARRAASTCAAPTTRSTTRSRRASATGSSTRSTTCGASTATCVSRRARPRRSPRRSCSSSRSRTAPTRSTRRTSCSSATTVAPSACRGSCGSAARTTTRASGCGRRRRPATRRTRAASNWSGELGFGVRPQPERRPARASAD